MTRSTARAALNVVETSPRQRAPLRSDALPLARLRARCSCSHAGFDSRANALCNPRMPLSTCAAEGALSR